MTHVSTLLAVNVRSINLAPLPGADALAWQQRRSTRVASTQSKKDGDWYSRLLQCNPKIVQSFSDHEEVAQKLAEAGQVDTLHDVACSGLLEASASRYYRAAHKRLTGR